MVDRAMLVDENPCAVFGTAGDEDGSFVGTGEPSRVVGTAKTSSCFNILGWLNRIISPRNRLFEDSTRKVPTSVIPG